MTNRRLTLVERPQPEGMGQNRALRTEGGETWTSAHAAALKAIEGLSPEHLAACREAVKIEWQHVRKGT